MKSSRIPIALLSLLASVPALAGNCVIHVTRAACPGKDAEAYSKCGGKASCDETKKTGSAEACAKAALSGCDNVGSRQKVTRSKIITADFEGASVEGGKNFCAADRPDFNKCD